MESTKSQILNKDFVVFLSTWGTEKTDLMVKKAEKLARQGQKVLIVIVTFGRISLLPTLLVHQLQHRFLGNDLIEILHVPYVDGTNHHKFCETAKKYEHILIDEFFGDFPNLSDRNQEEFRDIIGNKKTVWITMSNTYQLTMKVDLDQLAYDVKTKWFPFYHFEIVTLNEALRFSAKVGSHFQVLLDQMYGSEMPLNAALFMKATSSCLASKVVTIAQDFKDFKTCLKACLDELDDPNVLIMIEDLPTPIKSLIHQQEVIPLVFNQIFKDLGMKSPKYCTETFSNIEGSFKDHVLVTTYTMGKGIEHANIINFSGPLCHSRASGNIVNVPPNFNWVYLLLPYIQKLQMKETKMPSISPMEWIQTKFESRNLKLSTVYLNYFSEHNPLINSILDCEELNVDPESFEKSIFEALNRKSDCPFGSVEDLKSFRIWKGLAMNHKIRDYEDEIIRICCQLLRRKITLIPILDNDRDESFGQEFSLEFKILCLRTLGRFNIYITTKSK